MTVHKEECCSRVINSTISFDTNKQELHEPNCELVTKKIKDTYFIINKFSRFPFLYVCKPMESKGR